MEIDTSGKISSVKSYPCKKFVIGAGFHSFSGVVSAGAILLFAATTNAEAQYAYTTLSVPGAPYTVAFGISGTNIVGYYNSGIGKPNNGFLYNGSSYTTLSVPGEPDTVACGISGTNIVGFYNLGTNFLGFLYNGSSYTTLSVPGAVDTFAFGISGTNIVGYYDGGMGNPSKKGFLYNGSSYITLTVPGASNTYALGIYSTNIVGYYDNGTINLGFLYNGSSYTTLSVPGSVDTTASGISGTNIVGSWDNGGMSYSLGFQYNGSSYTTLSVPGSVETVPNGISGGNIVGYCYNGSIVAGFLAVPAISRPVLNVSFSNTNLVISWPTNFANFTLYQNSALSTTNWVTVTKTPTITNGQEQIVLPSPLVGYRFYRLQSQ